MIRSIAATLAAAAALLTGTPPSLAAVSAETLLARAQARFRGLRSGTGSAPRAMPEPAPLALNRSAR
jgi:hypothetical protein